MVVDTDEAPATKKCSKAVLLFFPIPRHAGHPRNPFLGAISCAFGGMLVPCLKMAQRLSLRLQSTRGMCVPH